MGYPTTFELPTTDKLTGFLTSAYFRHLLREQLVPHAKATGDPLSLLLFDGDSFHAINTTHGHQVGDQVLTAVSQTLRETLPDTAILVRYGGDEFGAALPDTPLDDTFTLAEEFRRRVAALRFDASPDIAITCSIGLAAFPTHGDNDVELVRAADQAVYHAKTSGRNKVALPQTDSRMVTKTSYYTTTQLERLAGLAKTVKRNEASLLREALDDLLKKYNDRLDAAQKGPILSEGPAKPTNGPVIERGGH